MRGSGHYSAARGLTGFVQGVGGSLAEGAAGSLVLFAGYGATFFTLALIATFPLALVLFALPETGPRAHPAPLTPRFRAFI